MEQWRDFQSRSENADIVALWVQEVSRDRDISDLLKFTFDTVREDLEPDITPGVKGFGLKDLMRKNQVIHRWSTDEEEFSHPGTAAWVSKVGGNKVITYYKSHWAEHIRAANDIVRSVFNWTDFSFAKSKEKSYKKLLKTIAITFMAPTVVHEYAHHLDPIHPFEYTPDVYIDDPDFDTMADSLRMGGYEEEDFDEREYFAQHIEKNYIKQVYSADKEVPIEYVLERIDSEIFNLIDVDLLAGNLQIKYEEMYNSLQPY